MFLIGQALVLLLAADLPWQPFDEAYSQAVESGKPLLVDFYTDWCHWCKVMDAKTFSHPEIAKLLREEFVLSRIHAEDSKASLHYRGERYNHLQFTRALGVKGFPSVAFFDKSGDLITVVPGYVEPSIFKYMLLYVRDACYTRRMSFQEFMERKGTCE